MLSDIKVKSAKAKNKPYKLNDGQGLYLQIAANGGKWQPVHALSCRRHNRRDDYKSSRYVFAVEISLLGQPHRGIRARIRLRHYLYRGFAAWPTADRRVFLLNVFPEAIVSMGTVRYVGADCSGTAYVEGVVDPAYFLAEVAQIGADPKTQRLAAFLFDRNADAADIDTASYWSTASASTTTPRCSERAKCAR